MNIGSLNKRIDIQAQTKVSDGMAGFTVTWVTLATVAAAIWPVSASEQVQAMGNVMTISHKIRIRYRSVMKASYRIKFGNSYFNIVSIVNPNMANKALDLLCKEAAS